MMIKFSVWWFVKLFQTAIEYVIRFGGGERDRTDDLLLAKQALSQLSYTPKYVYILANFMPYYGGPG
jgi:hypothetical protein